MKLTVIELILAVAIFAIVGATFQFLIILAMCAVLVTVPVAVAWLIIKEIHHAWTQRNHTRQP